MEYKKVVVAGGGVLGSQIAFQCAYKGFDTTIWLRGEASVERTKPRIAALRERYLAALDLMGTPEGKQPPNFSNGLADPKTFTDADVEALKKRVEDAFRSLRYEIDLSAAVAEADIVIETVAENPQAKIEFYTNLAKVIPEKTVVATNSSTMLPSHFAQYTGRPEKYLALHFANGIWKNNSAEVMGHPDTDPSVFEEVLQFAEAIGMVPIPVKKEQPGYILNTLLVPLLRAALTLHVNDVADPQSVDLTWRLGTGAPMGPFQILDIVGLDTAYNIYSNAPEVHENPDSDAAKIANMLKRMLEEGKKGAAVGEGFYKYR